jgi:hypothetical protein
MADELFSVVRKDTSQGLCGNYNEKSITKSLILLLGVRGLFNNFNETHEFCTITTGRR